MHRVASHHSTVESPGTIAQPFRAAHHHAKHRCAQCPSFATPKRRRSTTHRATTILPTPFACHCCRHKSIVSLSMSVALASPTRNCLPLCRFCRHQSLGAVNPPYPPRPSRLSPITPTLGSTPPNLARCLLLVCFGCQYHMWLTMFILSGYVGRIDVGAHGCFN
jgi:hypothetical protein